MKISFNYIFFSLWISLSSICFADIGSATIDNYKIMTEVAPPNNYMDNGKASGFAVELLELTLKEMKVNAKSPEFMPWSEAYKAVLVENNTMLFSMTRVEQREDFFKWAGPITANIISLVAPKSKNIKISNLKEAEKYIIGAMINDIGEQLLLNNNFPQEKIISTVDLTQTINNLKDGKTDMISWSQDSLFMQMEKEGINTNDYESVLVIHKGMLYYAFNKNTPDSLIQEFQMALDKVKQTDEFKKLLTKYKKSE
ncbi:MAG: transporter substrate-binding domain-containing protein [Pseudomonadota bacterium]